MLFAKDVMTVMPLWQMLVTYIAVADVNHNI